MAAEVKKARVKWVENMKFVGTGPSGNSMVMDTPPRVGGEGSAVTPGELMLIGLGGCTAVDVVSILNKMRVKFDDLAVDIEAEPVETHPKVYKTIKMYYRFKGCEDQNKAQKAVVMSKDKYCSVSAMLSKTADIDYEIIFED